MVFFIYLVLFKMECFLQPDFHSQCTARSLQVDTPWFSNMVAVYLGRLLHNMDDILKCHFACAVSDCRIIRRDLRARELRARDGLFTPYFFNLLCSRLPGFTVRRTCEYLIDSGSLVCTPQQVDIVFTTLQEMFKVTVFVHLFCRSADQLFARWMNNSAKESRPGCMLCTAAKATHKTAKHNYAHMLGAVCPQCSFKFHEPTEYNFFKLYGNVSSYLYAHARTSEDFEAIKTLRRVTTVQAYQLTRKTVKEMLKLYSSVKI